MQDIPLTEQIMAVDQAARAERHAALATVYPAERQLKLRRATALEAAANSLRTFAAIRDRRRTRK